MKSPLQRWSWIALVWVCSCTWLVDRELEDFEAEFPSEGGSGGVPNDVGGATATGATVSTGASTAGGAMACGVTPPGSTGACPGDCNGGCGDGACHVLCSETQQCKELLLRCPAGWPCEIACVGKQSCEKASLLCPDDLACSVQCTGEDACKDADVLATSGVLEVTCGSLANTCEHTVIQCGLNACRGHCLGDSTPQMECEASCECSPCED